MATTALRRPPASLTTWVEIEAATADDLVIVGRHITANTPQRIVQLYGDNNTGDIAATWVSLAPSGYSAGLWDPVGPQGASTSPPTDPPPVTPPTEPEPEPPYVPTARQVAWLSDAVAAGDKAAAAPRPSPWAANTAYALGQMVWQNGTLYRARTAFTSGSSFDPTTWRVVGAVIPPTIQAGTYTLSVNDAGGAVEVASSSAVTVTVPPAATEPFLAGNVVEIVQAGAGQVTIAPGFGVTVRSAGSLTSRTQWSVLSLRKRGSGDEWILSGDTT